jgi:hypothetical protein
MVEQVATKPARLKKRWIILGGVLAVVAAIAIRSLLAREILVPPGTPIRFDDFEFSVVGSREATLGKGPAARPYLVVSLKVDNNAKRVPYQFRRGIAVMVADDGHKYGVSPEGQTALDGLRAGADPLAAPLPASASATTELAFDLPPSATNPRMKISHGGPLLDVVDDLLGGKRRLKP